ncbi:MAG: hypothetical protein MUP82_10365 [Candidatus Marinimicrobia bacterium]|nr:hypothetical protein [Candidatus Neomarinimicrobiota bacterium]
MKKNQIEKTFDNEFTIRKKNFIKSHSAFNKCKNTFNLREMKSEAGVIKGKSTSGDQLEIQEIGGLIRNRDYIPMDSARIGKNKDKLVSKKFYLKNIKPKKGKSKFSNQEFIKSAFKAGKGGFVRFDNTLFEIRTIKKNNRKLFIRTLAIYSFKNNRSVSISKAPFIAPAGEISAKKIPEFFIKRAKRRFQK